MRLTTWTLATVWVALLCITSTTSQGTNVDGGFSQWTTWENATACSPTCGTVATRQMIRRRFCNSPSPSDGGRNCTGTYDDVIVVNCVINPCLRDGGLTPWTEWSGPACLQTCGLTFSRTVTRIKTCTNPTPLNGGRDCSLLGSIFQAETRSCNLPNCPIDGGLTLWTQWSNPPCPLTCGSFATKAVDRRRTCTNPVQAFGGRDCTSLGTTFDTRTISCNLPNCPINGTFTQWGSWDNPACGATCGQTATKTVRRTRICLPPQFGGFNCLGPLSETQEVSCGLGACPLDGGYSLWTEWSGVACTGTCGTSYTRTVTRVRTCNNPVPANNGRDCSQLGPSSESVGRLCPLTPCLIDGGFTPWAQWNIPSCGRTCGTFVTRTVTRNRTCTNPTPQFGGASCTGEVSQSEVRNCGLPSCPSDDDVGEWSQWSPAACTATCGPGEEGSVERSRSCITPANNISCTAALTETRMENCGLPICPGKCPSI